MEAFLRIGGGGARGWLLFFSSLLQRAGYVGFRDGGWTWRCVSGFFYVDVVFVL